jgi:adenosylhomocysteine nucleosidase
MKKIGIIVPMPEEVELILKNLKIKQIKKLAMREFFEGQIGTTECVVALSRIGKVASATTAVLMIKEFDVTNILLTGVAGAISNQLRIGDIVIAESNLQHDMDASPLFPPLEIPLLNKSRFFSDQEMVTKAQNFFKRLIQKEWNSTPLKSSLLTSKPDLYLGTVVSGDQFIKSESEKFKILERIPDALAVEMEGGAVAQVCYEMGIPFLNVRSVSDFANEDATIDFKKYVDSTAKHYTWWLVYNFCINSE